MPQEVYLSSIFSLEGTTGSELSFSARTQTSDYIYMKAGGASADANIELMGAGNDNEASSIELNAYGYSDGVIAMRGGTNNEKKSEIIITANGLQSSEIQIVGGNDNNNSYINIDSEKFTYKDNDVAVKPINNTFVSGNTIVLTDNYIYSGANIATLVINGTNFEGDCLIQFTTGSTTPSITISGLVFDVLPTFNSNKYYELGIHNGHCLWVEYDS